MKTSSNESKDFEMSKLFEDVSKNILVRLDTSNNFSKISEGQCRSIGSSFKKYNKFINKTINLLRRL